MLVAILSLNVSPAVINNVDLPDSIGAVEFHKVVEAPTDPTAHGGQPRAAIGFELAGETDSRYEPADASRVIPVVVAVYR